MTPSVCELCTFCLYLGRAHKRLSIGTRSLAHFWGDSHFEYLSLDAADVVYQTNRKKGEKYLWSHAWDVWMATSNPSRRGLRVPRPRSTHTNGKQKKVVHTRSSRY